MTADERRLAADRAKANAAGPLEVVIQVRTRAGGEFRLQPVPFGITFLAKPVVSASLEVLPGSVLTTGHFPQVTAGVWAWRQDSKGYYTGAGIFVVVDTNGTTTPYELLHHLTFKQTAVRLYGGLLG